MKLITMFVLAVVVMGVIMREFIVAFQLNLNPRKSSQFAISGLGYTIYLLHDGITCEFPWKIMDMYKV